MNSWESSPFINLSSSVILQWNMTSAHLSFISSCSWSGFKCVKLNVPLSEGGIRVLSVENCNLFCSATCCCMLLQALLSNCSIFCITWFFSSSSLSHHLLSTEEYWFWWRNISNQELPQQNWIFCSASWKYFSLSCLEYHQVCVYSICLWGPLHIHLMIAQILQYRWLAVVATEILSSYSFSSKFSQIIVFLQPGLFPSFSGMVIRYSVVASCKIIRVMGEC